MRAQLLKFVCLPVCLWMAMSMARGQETGHVKFIGVTHRFKVAEDFSVESSSEIEYKVLTEEGARQNVRFPLSYNKALGTLEIVIAETLKADGRRIPVPASGIARQSGSAGFQAMKDLEVLSLAFPDLAPGDSARLLYRQNSRPLLPSSFSFVTTIVPTLAFDKVSIHLDAPEKMPLYFQFEGFGRQDAEPVAGRRIEHWTYRQPGTVATEANSTEARIRQPHVWISSFASWDEMAGAYRKLYEPQAVVTPEIAALARELTAGAETPRDKAQRIYDWVRKNIRYVAIYAGLEGWVPHPAGEVLANRFGDCKDHAVLLDALLKAEGIRSVPVLIQADLLNYALPETAAHNFFNHMISYLPELDLYLDSTSAVAEFGRLPDTDQGKQVLRPGLVPALGQTPASKAEARQARRSTKIQLASDGSATVSSTLWFGGDFRVWYEQFKGGLANGREDVWATQQLTAQKRRGAAVLKWLPDKNGWRGFVIAQKIENFLPESEIGLLDFGHAYSGAVSEFSVLDLFETRARKSSFLCQAVDIEDTVEITLADNLKLLRLPRDQQLSAEGAELRVAYSQQDQRYVMKRSFRWQPPVSSASCSAEDWRTRLEGMRKMRSAVKSAVLAYERS